MASQTAIRVLFVCMGNICRSPTAEGVFRKQVEAAGLAGQIEIDSAGTHAYHVGEPPDARAQAAARLRGVDLSLLRGRQAVAEDIRRFDYVLAMDEDNQENLLSICPGGLEDKVELFMEYASGHPREVPDPYFGGAAGFDRVLDMIEAASEGLLEDIRQRL
ncbi:MAG: phosphotyrosine protein phosphatase [Candidatus Muproteobacteria bacterium RBG_16_62_13]|uniref:protein-tyrosine-phosphatase n=1 Tax=Candidatus Muproteobacteria bacterium RBG_16_62_13 TaxID=1817756 RepID=A0A1F6T4L4_9PROT|nr:MAG: phosphotyrosine protein phosphatase [Candidatus Muproteobacteria bacterium RBG_16_62_13]